MSVAEARIFRLYIAEIPGLAVTLEGRVSAIRKSTAYHGQFFAPCVAMRIDFKTSHTLNYAGIVGLRHALFQAGATAAIDTAAASPRRSRRRAPNWYSSIGIVPT